MPRSWKQTAGLLVAIAGVGAAFVVVLGIGFAVSGDPVPPEISALFYPAVVVFSVAVVALAYKIPDYLSDVRQSLRPGSPCWGPKADRSKRDFAREREEYVATLAADPLRKRFVPLIERGEHWSPDRIDYAIDTSRTATCEHLRAVEQAMRSAGLDVRLVRELVVEASCTVDVEALSAGFVLPDCVRYEEPEMHGRSFEDGPIARIRCSACESIVWVVHPDCARSETRRFP